MWSFMFGFPKNDRMVFSAVRWFGCDTETGSNATSSSSSSSSVFSCSLLLSAGLQMLLQSPTLSFCTPHSTTHITPDTLGLILTSDFFFFLLKTVNPDLCIICFLSTSDSDLCCEICTVTKCT